uniref:U17-lycotoxin-Ls1a n=1 Tax=Lycosa singoriensis TaxID=434756 RepID=TX20A_LYCSI|nr:RecName: Full=U17-lycotoxin-Ls1a; Short=U17-LCTX-Ls1a; AltName: Full=Toxin-like structure LSTX-P3; Flags: Precursor [Lycosa singoriensis]ACI41470.1 toxin-like structure LSTX-P3 precursor [Lycosa singoriensis]CAS03739.1 toxin-like structure LSTX-P3 precursor [Lycosa singoriensis]
MSSKVQAVLLLVGVITFLAVHAQEELSENTESERSCARLYERCSMTRRPCCNNVPYVCSLLGTYCECKKGLIQTVGDFIGI